MWLTPIQYLVKYHADKLLYSRDAGPLASRRLNVPTAIEVLDFSKGCHPGPTIDSFRIDPASGPGSSWNMRVCQVFAQDFCAAQYPGAGGRATVDALYEFHQLLPTFISHHAVASGFPDVESYERFHEHLSKRIRRHRVCYPFDYVDEDCELSVPYMQLAESRLKIVNELQGLREFLPVIRRLAEEDGMSSDERDGGELHSTRPFWRHSSVTNWLHSLDSIGSETVHNSVRCEVRRRSSSKVDMESHVVKGLPANFYDWNYLNSLDRSQYLDLDPGPVMALELNDSLWRSVQYRCSFQTLTH